MSYHYPNVVSCVAALFTCSILSTAPRILKDPQMRTTNSDCRQRTVPAVQPLLMVKLQWSVLEVDLICHLYTVYNE